jgi:alanine dehydrogenase
MIIGVPREIHRHEHRVALTPYGAKQLTRRGHTVVVEKAAGLEALFSDREYEVAGAQIVYSSEEAYKRADLVARVGILSSDDLDYLKPGSVIGAFHHLTVASRAIIERLQELKMTIIGYELIEDPHGRRPLLIPFSEMAGQMAVYIAAHYLQNEGGGRGILLGAVPGIAPPTIVILGAGTVGRTAARRARAIGAHVIVLDADLEKLRVLSRELGRQIVTQVATPERLARYSAIADVVIGAILIPGARTPYLITEEMVKTMRTGSVIIDVSIDQGGCSETSRPTTLDDPAYIVHDVVHYCVPNMTANVARTASRALSDAVVAHIGAVMEHGVGAALREDPWLAAGVYMYEGTLVHEELAAAMKVSATPLGELLGGGAAS